MPFLTYQLTAEQAMGNASRLFQEGGAAAVKLEGGRAIADTVRRLTTAGVPVLGHIGLPPSMRIVWEGCGNRRVMMRQRRN
jgi:3-methyl-2-oxobutanoate hydroxymethyltransferase